MQRAVSLRQDGKARVFFSNGPSSGSISTSPITSGLQLYLDAGISSSYPGSGSTWSDLSGNNRNATLYSTPTFVSSGGGYFTFNGTNQYAAPAAGFANFTTGITIFAIANFGTAQDYERIIDFGNGAPGANITFSRQSTGTGLSMQFMASGSFFGTDNFGETASGTGVVDNSAFACYAGTANGVNSFLYKNGAQVFSMAQRNLPINATRNNCYIARANWAGQFAAISIGVLMLYNRLLTADEIARNYLFFKDRYGI